MRRLSDALIGAGEALGAIMLLAYIFPTATELGAVAIVSSATMFGIASRGDVSAWIMKWAVIALIYVALASYMILDPLVRLIMNAIAWVAGRLAGHAYGLGKRFA